MILALYLLAHPGQPLSLQALSKGLGLPSVAQTGRMVHYLQDAWMVLAVPRFSSSFKQRVTSPPKYYAVDTDLATAPHEWECDFVTDTAAIQCCARLTPENRERELRGLLRAAAVLGSAKSKTRELLVITLDQEDTLIEQGRSIRIIPGWKWLD